MCSLKGLRVSVALLESQVLTKVPGTKVLTRYQVYTDLREVIGYEEGEVIGKPAEGKDENNGGEHLDHALHDGGQDCEDCEDDYMKVMMVMVVVVMRTLLAVFMKILMMMDGDGGVIVHHSFNCQKQLVFVLFRTCSSEPNNSIKK